MPIVSITMIVELNKQLRERGLPYQIHLSDACGKQSMWIEELEDTLLREVPDDLIQAVGDYFQKQRISLEFSPDKHAFWAR